MEETERHVSTKNPLNREKTLDTRITWGSAHRRWKNIYTHFGGRGGTKGEKGNQYTRSLQGGMTRVSEHLKGTKILLKNKASY